VDLAPLLAVALLAYLIGSFPTGAVIARLYRNVDLTRVGSERTGATNVSRTLGMGAGVIVLLGDFGKGMLAIWVAQRIDPIPLATAVAGFLTVVGHNRSIFLKGRGGRGVVTGLGGLSVAAIGVFIPACLTGCIVSTATRYISLGSICGCAMAIVAGIVGYATGNLPVELLVYTIVTPAYVIAAHADNIARLRAGTERRLGQRQEPARP
jgi:glycerol-3-phosphate acyltransferase PlsY